eukprot:SAG11_NODE_6646_length_1274_cov_1.742128_1_plen_258_part_01
MQIPLKLVIDHITEGAYKQLLALEGRRGHVSAAVKRRDLNDYAHLMRSIFEKLLGLLRWARGARRMDGLNAIREFTFRSRSAVCNVANALAEFEESTLNAIRVPRFDVASAAMVLSTGNYTSLPTKISAPARAAAAALEGTPLQPEGAEGGAKLEYLLNTRLRAQDDGAKIVAQLRRIEHAAIGRATLAIRDAAVHISVPGLFELGLTLRGTQAPWIVLHTRILIRAEQPAAEPGAGEEPVAGATSMAAVSGADVGRL